MKLKALIFFCSLLLVQSLAGQLKHKKQPAIFDSDMGPDYDDVGAITLLHAFADQGDINILGTMASTRYEGVAAVFNVFNTYFNHPGIPIGIPKKNGLYLKDFQHWTDSLLIRYPHTIKANNEVPDATELYRKLLASQKNGSVIIITVGFLTNLSNLLQSQPDQYSRLNGVELVRKKVKRLVCMAGKFPNGKEFNIEKDVASAEHVFSNWPGEIILSGFEIGQKIKTGLPLIHNVSIQKSPVKDVFAICIPKSPQDSNGRMSWDETAVLIAVKGHKPFYTLKRGIMVVVKNGSNTWDRKGKKHAYLFEKESPEKVQDLINNLIMHQPQNK
jgi:inosine-uridine nucleoside N-ribohydrolase